VLGEEHKETDNAIAGTVTFVRYCHW
jgi:hypothetical protein